MTEEQNKLAEEEPEAMKWFRKGRESVLRKNQSGCCCLFNEEDEIVSVCAAHEDWAAEREPATEAVRDQVLEEAAKACEQVERELHWSTKWCVQAIRALKGKGASHGVEDDYAAAIVKAALIATDPKSPSGNVPIDWARLRTACEKYRAASLR